MKSKQQYFQAHEAARSYEQSKKNLSKYLLKENGLVI